CCFSVVPFLFSPPPQAANVVATTARSSINKRADGDTKTEHDAREAVILFSPARKVLLCDADFMIFYCFFYLHFSFPEYEVPAAPGLAARQAWRGSPCCVPSTCETGCRGSPPHCGWWCLWPLLSRHNSCLCSSTSSPAAPLHSGWEAKRSRPL